MTTRQRTSLDLVDVVPTWLARADRGLKLVEGIDVDDGLLSVVTYAVHGAVA